MKKYYLHLLKSALFLMFFISAMGSLQELKAQSQLCLGVGGSADDAGYALVQTSDGGYVIAGDTKSFGAGGSDVYVVKLDSMGTIKWTRTVGGTGNDFARSMIKTTDGGFVISGYTNSFGAGGNDVYIVKLDSAGTVQWTRTVGGTKDDIGYQIIQTSDGGYAVGGTSNSFGLISEMYLLKLDSSGNKKWDSRVSRGNIACFAYGLTQTPDGHFVLCGTTPGQIPSGMYAPDWYVVKIDSGSTHNLLWSRVIVPYPGENYYTQANRVINTKDGGLLVAGYGSQPQGGGYTHDMYAVKLDAGGNLSWSSFYGGIGTGSGNNDDQVKSVIETVDGGFMMAGFSRSFGALYFGSQTIYLVKTDANGTMEWNRVIGTKTADQANDIIQTSDSGYAVTGFTLYPSGTVQNMSLVKLDINAGNGCCVGVGGAASAANPSTSTVGTSGTASGTVVMNSGTSSTGGFATPSNCGVVAVPPVAAFQASDSSVCSNSCINFNDLGAYGTSWSWSFPGGLPSTSSAQHPTVCYLTPGVYDVSFYAYNSAGTDSAKATALINVVPSPPTPSIQQVGDTLFCSTDPSYESYQWYDSSVVIPGATDTFLVINHTGNYNVSVANSDSCTIAVGINVILLGVNTPANDGVKGLVISPNPVVSELMVSGYPMGENNKVTIYNILGELIDSRKLGSKSASFRLDCSAYPSGVYFISVGSKHSRRIDRFIKE